jgi:TolB-like protein
MKGTIVLFIAGALMLAACTNNRSAQLKDGKEYSVTSGTFRDRWWNYYERGLSFAEGEFYGEAVQDFQGAIEKRAKDQWRSRTYGMHFVDYFPHREIGAIFYNQKKYEDAVRELEESLSTAESSKAKYFLNKTRKAILEETKQDTLPPSLKISFPEDGSITNKFSIILSGEAEDDHFVSSLSVNDAPFLLELSSKTVPFERELNLKSGTNKIKIQAADLTGKTAERTMNIEVDREGPVIIVEDIVTTGHKAVVTGFISDTTGISFFSVNGQDIPIVQGTGASQNLNHEVGFHQEITLSAGMDSFIMKAGDMAENITTGELRIPPNSQHQRNQDPDSRLKGFPMLALNLPLIDGADLEQYAFLEDIIDNTPPVISLRNLIDVQTVYDDKIFLEGSVSDGSKIRSLTINGESILKRKGREIFFNHLAGLDEGVNRFSIEAVDTFGNSAKKEITVIRNVPKTRQIKSRMSISVLPLGHKGELSVSGDAVYDNIIAAFVDQRRFNLVEREKLEEILRELKLNQTELVDPDTASKLGKIVAADSILTGSIYENKNSIEVLTRLVDTETSEIIESHDIFDEDKSISHIKMLMQGLAWKYKQSFPVLEGLVIKKEGSGILVDLGSINKIKRNMGIILFREGEEVKHPVTAKILGSEPVELGEGKIKEVYEEYSSAVIKKGKYEKVKVQDKVITK